MLCAMKEKTLPYPNVTPELVNEAFPGLLRELIKPVEKKEDPPKTPPKKEEKKEKKSGKKSLSKMNVTELKAVAKELGIKGTTKMKKADLLSSIKQAKKEQKDAWVLFQT